MPTATRDSWGTQAGGHTGGGEPGERSLLVSTLPPGPAQTRLAGRILLALLVVMALTLPFARLPLTGTEILVPAYATAVLMNEGITAALLFALFAIQRSRALLVLAVGYLFTGLMIVPWALTFPGVFAPTGLLGAGLNSTAALAAVRRLALPTVMLAYALLKDAEPEAAGAPAPRILWSSVLGTLAAAGAVSWFCITQNDHLPRLMASLMKSSDLWPYVIHSATALCLAALAILWRRRRSVLDLWLGVALSAWLIETVLLGYLSADRFSLGWWAGRSYGLISASVVLLVLLSEATVLYAQLARSVAAERRVRGEKLTGMEVLSASIAHEVNQPLASMVASAAAGLRWLDRPEPDLNEARAALRRISEDGQRAGRMIECIRAVFRRGPRERAPLDLTALIHAALRHTRAEMRLGGVAVRTEFAKSLPPSSATPFRFNSFWSISSPTRWTRWPR